MSGRFLGKRLGVVEDPRTFLARDLITMPKAPPTHFVAHTLQHLPVFANDEIGDCGLASQGHRIVCEERSAGQDQRRIDLTDADVIGAYSAVSGYDPRTGANDNGVYLLDVLRYLRTTGMGRDEDGRPHRIGAYAKVDVANHAQVRLALYVFGGLYFGAGLPRDAQGQVGTLWKVTDGAGAAFGSWGGHAMYARGYAATFVEAFTWGERQRMTWGWWNAYVDEAYAVISPDYLRASGRTPQGFEVAKLQEMLSGL